MITDELREAVNDLRLLHRAACKPDTDMEVRNALRHYAIAKFLRTWDEESA